MSVCNPKGPEGFAVCVPAGTLTLDCLGRLFVDTNVLYHAGAPNTNQWGANIKDDPGLGRMDLPCGQNFWQRLHQGNARVFITKDVAGEVDRAKDNSEDEVIPIVPRVVS